MNNFPLFFRKVVYLIFKGMLWPILCTDINTHSKGNEKFCKIYLKKLFCRSDLVFIDIFYRYREPRYFIYSDFMWRHVWTCNAEIFTQSTEKVFLYIKCEYESEYEFKSEYEIWIWIFTLKSNLNMKILKVHFNKKQTDFILYNIWSK